MAQTPKSASVTFSSTTPTTIYTVPAGATAVVNSVIPTSVVGGAANVTLNKVSSTGTIYPLAIAAETSFGTNSSTYYYLNQVPNINLLPASITLSAGESISISTSTSTYFKDPISVSNTNYILYGANYVNGNYVVLGQDTSTGYGLVLTSTDGINWTQRTFNYYVLNQDITYGNGYYVICNQSSSGKIHYSTDLVTWTEVSLPSPYAMYSIEFGNNRFVVGGSSGFAFSATSTPVTWTAITFPNGGLGSTINSIKYIGTNYVFGTEGATFASTNLSTFTTPSYAYDANGIGASRITVSATRVFQTVANAINTLPTRALLYTTDGQTWTNVTTLSATSGSPYGNNYPCAFGNGSVILIQPYWDSSPIYYSRSGDNGATWTNVSGFGISNYNQTGTSYATSVYPVFDTTRNYVGTTTAGYVQMNAVDASGTITSSASMGFQNSASSFTTPVSFAGNPTTGAWIAVTGNYYYGNTQYWSWWWGTSPTNGSNSQNHGSIVYIPSIGRCSSALYRPASNGYLFGSTNGYFAYNTSETDTSLSWSRPTAQNSPIAAFACDGNLATSKIVYVQNNGYGAVSTNQGVDWTTMRLPGSGFGSQGDYGNKCLQYVNGVWIAVNTSGQTFYSTTALTWSTAPITVSNIATMNSNNVFLTTSGVFTSSGSSVTSFTRTSQTAFSSYPSIRNMVYASSKYLIGMGSTLYQSTDLITWTGVTVSSTQINDVVYWTTALGTPLLLDGSGNILPVGARRASPTAEGKIGKPISIADSLVVGNVTAGIVEIT